MKKALVTLLVASFLTLTAAPATANNEKSLVIIDSYFDSRVIGGNVSCVTLANKPCDDVVLAAAIPKSLSSAINHGNAMVEVAKRQNPNLKILALRATTPSPKNVSEVNAGNFIDALNWVSQNASSVGAVAVSRYFNGNKPCFPSAVNTAVHGGAPKADLTIRSLIKSLKDRGIKVFVSTGNTRGTKIDYPACILDTESVSVGGKNKLGVTVSAFAADASTDYFASADIFSYVSPVYGLIPNTTSAGNVAVAAISMSQVLSDKFIKVSR